MYINVFHSDIHLFLLRSLSVKTNSKSQKLNFQKMTMFNEFCLFMSWFNSAANNNSIQWRQYNIDRCCGNFCGCDAEYNVIQLT